MEKLDLNKLEAKDGVIKVVHLTEEAEKLFYEKPVTMAGTIKAPGNFIEKRKDQDEELRSNVTFSYRNRVIMLETLENWKEFGYNIKGELIVNPEIKYFGINENRMFTVKEMVKHIRMRKFLFESEQQHQRVLEALQNFTAKVDTEIKKINDQRGNIEDVYKTTLKSNAELAFSLKMRVFIGEEEKIIRIEVACEADNSAVRFWFESPDLIILLEADTKAIIDAELKRFPETFVFIEQ